MKNDVLIRQAERIVSDNPSDFQSFFKLGMLYFEAGNMQRSIFCLEKALSLKPHWHTVRYNLGVIYSIGKGFTYAVKEWQKIIDLDGDFCFQEVDRSLVRNMPAAIRAWGEFEKSENNSSAKFFTLGFVLYVLGNYESSAESYLKCLAMNPNFTMAAFFLGLSYFNMGNYEMAVKYFMEDAASRPQYPNTAYHLGLANQKLGKMHQAVASYQKAIQLKPRYLKANFQLAVAYNGQDLYEQSEKVLHQLISYDASFAPAYMELGLLYHKQYKMEEAANEYEKALKANPSYKEAAFKLGELNKSLGKLEPALKYFLIASELEPGDVDIPYYIGSIYVQQKKYPEAVAELKKSIQLNPSNAYALYALGEVYFSLGNFEEAIGMYRKGLLVSPKDKKFRNALGKTLFQQGDLERAISEFQSVLDENPSDAFSHYYLGLALFKSGNIAAAAKEYQRSVEFNPNSAYAHFCLGASYSTNKEFELAEEEFQKAMTLTPNTEAELALYGTLQLLASIGIAHARQGQELERRLIQIRDVYRETVRALANAIDARDPYTRYHSVRVSRIAKCLALHVMEIDDSLLTESEIEDIEIGGLLHDVGKIAIPDYIVRKEAALTDEEMAYMRRHPVEGVRILENIQFPWNIIPIVRYHHEKFNGRGYPDGLTGEEIPLGAMIVCISDVYDALVTDRPYRKGYSSDAALEIINRGKGLDFAEGIVDAFVEIVPRLPRLLADTAQRKED